MLRTPIFTTATTLATLATMAFATGSAQASSIPLQVDGSDFHAYSDVVNGTTYIALRPLLDNLGDWSIYWDSDQGAAVGVSDHQTLVAHPGNDTISLNGDSTRGGVAVFNGTTYVPLRTVMDLLGGGVEWDSYLDGVAITSAGASYDAADYYWLSRIISAESQGEPYEGQVAVGNVVLNRVEASNFPDSIPDVIFDTKYAVQFEPTANNTIYLDPVSSAQQAAHDVLTGADVMPDALYFYAPALSDGTWIRTNREFYKTIGAHDFYL